MRTRSVAVAVLLVAAIAGCSGSAGSGQVTPSGAGSGASIVARHSPSPPPPSSRPVAPHVEMVAWHGPVEELFVHPLVINPELAFTSDQLGVGFQNNFVTALEFRRILDDLWRNGWTFVDVHRAAAGTVRVPEGRRPVVFSEDDVNYYRYFAGRGLASRLVLTDHGAMAELPSGRLTDQDVVPLVDAEIARHPEFSADGAKGVLAVTGYEGLFGEHHADRPAARKRLIALGRWLTNDGWTIASHTWGHINLSTNSLSSIAWDTAQWKAVARPVLGGTDVLVYPFGARPSPEACRQLARAGYRIQIDIDVVARTVRHDGAVVMSRRHVDGYAFDAPRRQLPFYDVANVRDPARPH
jgi:hypothetical protein